VEPRHVVSLCVVSRCHDDSPFGHRLVEIYLVSGRFGRITGRFGGFSATSPGRFVAGPPRFRRGPSVTQPVIIRPFRLIVERCRGFLGCQFNGRRTGGQIGHGVIDEVARDREIIIRLGLDQRRHRLWFERQLRILGCQGLVSLIQRPLLTRQFVDHPTVTGRVSTDLGRRQTDDLDRRLGRIEDGLVAVTAEESRHDIGLGRTDPRHRARQLGDQFGRRGVRHEFAVAHDNQVIGQVGQLIEVTAGDEDGPAFTGQILDQAAGPVDPIGVQTGQRFVQQDGVRIAEQSGGDAEPLIHAA
jgi:hypothetical protein